MEQNFLTRLAPRFPFTWPFEISSTVSTKENKATLSKLDVRALPVSYAVKIVTAGLVESSISFLLLMVLASHSFHMGRTGMGLGPHESERAAELC